MPDLEDTGRFEKPTGLQMTVTLLAGKMQRMRGGSVQDNEQILWKAIEGADPQIQVATLEGFSRVLEGMAQAECPLPPANHTPQGPEGQDGTGRFQRIIDSLLGRRKT